MSRPVAHYAIVPLNFVSYVEYETAADLRKAIEGLDNREFKGANVHCAVDVSCPAQPSHSVRP